MADRWKVSDQLDWPFPRAPVRAVGVWHIYAHIRKCFARYNPLYVRRIGLIDGKILEVLWSGLNAILNACRSMSLGHRAETINDALNWLNRKKNVNASELPKSHGADAC